MASSGTTSICGCAAGADGASGNGTSAAVAWPSFPGKTMGKRSLRRRIASAATRKESGRHAWAACAAIASTHCAKPCNASVANDCIGTGMGFCSASQALSICSMAHPASPKSFRPTMRELPLSVWNARRKVVCSLKSPGVLASTCKAAKPFVTTSRASSRKISSSSSSSSCSAVAWAGTELTGTTGVAGAATTGTAAVTVSTTGGDTLTAGAGAGSVAGGGAGTNAAAGAVGCGTTAGAGCTATGTATSAGAGTKTGVSSTAEVAASEGAGISAVRVRPIKLRNSPCSSS